MRYNCQIIEKEPISQFTENSEIFVEREIIPKPSDILRELRVGLKVTNRELALMHGVNPLTIRRWLRGGSLSEHNLEEITETYFALQTLRGIFIEDKLPEVLRRPAQGLKGFSAMDLILDGQIKNVVNFYADLTSYSDGIIWGMRFHSFSQ